MAISVGPHAGHFPLICRISEDYIHRVWVTWKTLLLKHTALSTSGGEKTTKFLEMMRSPNFEITFQSIRRNFKLFNFRNAHDRNLNAHHSVAPFFCPPNCSAKICQDTMRTESQHAPACFSSPKQHQFFVSYIYLLYMDGSNLW